MTYTYLTVDQILAMSEDELRAVGEASCINSLVRAENRLADVTEDLTGASSNLSAEVAQHVPGEAEFITVEFDDDYGLPKSVQISTSDIPRGFAVEDIYGTRWCAFDQAWVEVAPGKPYSAYDQQLQSSLRQKYPNTYWD